LGKFSYTEEEETDLVRLAHRIKENDGRLPDSSYELFY